MKRSVFNCPSCSQKIDAPSEMEGESIICPTCGCSFTGPRQGQPLRSLVKLFVFATVVVAIVCIKRGFSQPNRQNSTDVNQAAKAPVTKEPVTGAAGFVLGERLNEAFATKPDDDGGFSYQNDGLTNIPPFHRVRVSATDERLIYSINLETPPLNEFKTTFNTLTNLFAEKYGFRFENATHDSEQLLFFGTSDRTLCIIGLEPPGSIFIVYSDDKLETAFKERKKKQAVDDAKHIAPSL